MMTHTSDRGRSFLAAWKGACLLLALLAGIAPAQSPGPAGAGRTISSSTSSKADAAPVPVAADAAVACPGGGTGWQTPEELRLAPPNTALSAWALLTGAFSVRRLLGAAEIRAQEWFGLDKVEWTGDEVRMEKEFGGRLTIQTAAGFGASAEVGVQAEYPVWRSWTLRSETRERGESFFELRRDFVFP